jgi:hypothetical protein
MDIAKKLKASHLALFVALTILLTACSGIINSDDYDLKKIKANPTLNLPLAFGNLTIDDFLSKVDSTHIKVDKDGLVYLSYEQTLRTQGINDLLDFPSRSFTKIIPLRAATLPARSDRFQYTTLNTNEDFNFSPEKLTEIKFKTTTVKITVTFTPANPASNNFEVQVKLPNFKLNGSQFDKLVTAGAAGVTFPLKDYVATMNNNAFPMEVTVFEKAHQGTITLANGTSASVKIDFTNMDFQYIRGFFGDQTTGNIPAETINLDAFGPSLNKATVSFAKPTLSFKVSNDYGIPTRVTFNPLEARKDNGTKLNISMSPASPVNINLPANLGQSAITDVTVTNAKQLLDFAPDQFFYKVSARINQGLTSGTNFCADTSKIRVTMKIEVPLHGKASGILLTDTFAIDLTDAKKSQVESGKLIFKITNQLPLDAFIQLYLANDLAIITDSLFTTAQTNIVRASTVDSNGDLLKADPYTTEIDVPKLKLDKIFAAKNIIVKARMNTTRETSGNQPDVKFKSSYKMSVDIGLKVKLKLEVDL